MSEQVVYGTTERGNATAIHRNYEYIKRYTKSNGAVYWRCIKYKSFKCKATLMTTADGVVLGKLSSEHTHSGNGATSLATKAVSEMKDKMNDIGATPSSSQGSVAVNLDPHVLMALPKRSLLNRTLQCHRAKHMRRDDGSGCLPPPPKDTNFDVPERFADMILFDSGSGSDRLIMMGCPELLDGLARAKLWLADGTFKVVPTMFFQLYTIHFELTPGTNPVGLYCRNQLS